ncbi:MAG: L-serine ammonia-lyase [Maricaulis sp.]|uniref:L-serine ammonia-lyase n=1 Tax=Maricaulis sp. TaxID=1486257 RepID=UPI001B29B221|nr:L-serine ammonia-lyase [Maricaulis sp.]MBO6730290.1 L-serine ammonia-lyase [Maricaulis sp.]MBO6846478.1 L-serine ammonia-lyase [Maricaulis sp.]MBO6876709.1 L-serine ammonia-lyase [Maricaulis sp.]
MHFGVFDLFKIGIGPSSSHTVGPMKAGKVFMDRAIADGLDIARIETELYGSLALTGLGHGTDTAVLLGLEGNDPAKLNPDTVPDRLARIRQENTLKLANGREIPFVEKQDLDFRGDIRLPFHSNALKFRVFGPGEDLLREEIWYSIGGGFVIDEHDAGRNSAADVKEGEPYPFNSAQELLDIGERTGLSIHRIMLENERAFLPEDTIRAGIEGLWRTMEDCIDRGLRQDGILPGGLNVKRRAPKMFRDLKEEAKNPTDDPLAPMDWINLWAMAVNEENAAGGRVVTAPTNGAAGIIPAVARYFDRYHRDPDDEEALQRFFLTAAAIGSLYKKNASISGAEAGCQGEVGVACSMAAGALAAAMGADNHQIEDAAEIGMEHNLGLTCDPVGGLVQVPCIERNAIGAIKAIDAARLALRANSEDMKVSLDQVIETMRQTGLDMMEKYKETSQGGLAVNVVEC